MMIPGRAPGRSAPGALARLLDAPLAGLSDGELLARFVARRDERAFEGLVDRLGPMVLATCRRMLVDRADADDAFQATFLVLVRRAGAVGRGELVGPWLHGVAVRVCRKARARSGRLRAREQVGAAVAPDPPAPSPGPPGLLEAAEAGAAVDEEIARLPGEARRLVVLADVEGLPRAEVAARLGWTENMVRGRLARARARIRSRLVARGCVPPGLAPGLDDATPLPRPLPLPPALATATARAALAAIAPAGRTAAAALATASALSLADGVTRTMILAPWKFAGAALLGATLATAGTASILSARQVPAPPQVPAPADPPTVAAPPPPAGAPLRTLLEDRARKAKARQEAQQDFYNQGRITIDRLIDADHNLMEAEQALAKTPAERRASVQAYVDRLRAIVDNQVKEMALGRATKADVAEAEERLLEARIMLAQLDEPPAAAGGPPRKAPASQPAPPDPAVAGWEAARAEQARELLSATREQFLTARADFLDYLDAIATRTEAELAVAPNREARVAALEAPVKELQEAVAMAKTLKESGRATHATVLRAQVALLDAQIRAAGGGGTAADLDRRLTELERKVDRVLDLLDSKASAPEQRR